MKILTHSFHAAAVLLAAVTAGHAQANFTKITTGPGAPNSADTTGTAWVDFDNDGDLDLYAGDDDGVNRLYRNDGSGVFTQITNGPIVNAGLGTHGASWADFDNDGRIDLFISMRESGPGVLFHQQADGTFTQSVLGQSAAFGAGWADYDNDGWLDLLVAYDYENIFWHNNGQGVLASMTSTQIDVSGDAITWADYDNDGDMDLFVPESWYSGGGNSRLYRNDGNGVITRITNQHLVQHSTLVSAAAWGDYDNDGFPDLFLPRAGNSGQAEPSFLIHNDNGTFTQVQQSPFTNDVGFAWNCSWADYDNDGWLDLFVSEFGGGKNRLYHNNGDGSFSRVLTGTIAEDVGYCTASTWGDYDRDGFLDLFVGTSPEGTSPKTRDFLYHNDRNSNAWITIKCVGTRSNRSAIGAKVRVKATIGGKNFWQLREVNTGDGWSGVTLETHFGLGDATNIETLRIEWPSGTVQEFQNVAAKQFLTVTEPARLVAAPSNGAPRFILQGGRNLQYDVQWSTNLTAWSLLGTLMITNLNGAALITDTNAPASNHRFYRAVQP